MKLPSLVTPEFEFTLPSTGKVYKYRPFLVKEEKILLMALDGKDQNEIVKAVKQIISNCVDGIDIDILPMFDIEYVFIQLRMKSVGEHVTLRLKHLDDSECKFVQEVDINLSEVSVNFPKNHKDQIQLTDEVGVKLKHPSIELIGKLNTEQMSVDDVFNLIIDCIEMIYDKESIYKSEDHTREELEEFINSLNQTQFNEIRNFFETMPKISKNIKYVCNGCGKTEEYIIEGLQNFFTFA